MQECEKLALVKKAMAEGIINDPGWLERLNDPMPAWAVLELVLKAMEKLDPPYIGFD